MDAFKAYLISYSINRREHNFLSEMSAHIFGWNFYNTFYDFPRKLESVDETQC